MSITGKNQCGWKENDQLGGKNAMTDIETSIFFCRKEINGELFELGVWLEPISCEHRCSYRFEISRTVGQDKELNVMHDAAFDRETARELFDQLAAENILPEALFMSVENIKKRSDLCRKSQSLQ